MIIFDMSSSSPPSGSGSDHPPVKQPEILQISQQSRNIKKPPLPPGAPKHRPPLLTVKKKTETLPSYHPFPPLPPSSTVRPAEVMPLPGSSDYNIIAPPLPMFKTPPPRLYYRPEIPDSDADAD